MTISTTVTKNIYDGDGVTVNWPYTFPLISGTDIQVIITDQYGTQSLLMTGYTVDTVNKRVVYPTLGSPLPGDGSTIELKRVLPLLQAAAFSYNGPFPPPVIERALDALTMMIQQLQEEIDIMRSDIAAIQAGGGGGGGGGTGLTPEPTFSDDIVQAIPAEGVIVTTPNGTGLFRIYVSDRVAGANSEELLSESVGTYGTSLYNINPGKGIVFTTPDGTRKVRVAVSNNGEITSDIATMWAYDITITAATKGLVVTTPDGQHTVRIAVSDFPEITTEELS